MRDTKTARRAGAASVAGGRILRPAGRAAVLAYLGLVVALPIGMVFGTALSGGPSALWEALTDEEAVAAYRLTFSAAAVVTAVDILFGVAAAYVLVRIPFPGRRFLDACVDLPLALPTSVTGLTLAALLVPDSPIGGFLERRGWSFLYEPAAVYLGFAAVTVPFVIRAVQPILLTLDPAEEEAAVTLGASPIRTFLAVVLPALRPGILAGGALAFARSLGEFGAVVFIAGTEPFRTEVASTFVYTRIESFDLPAAASASVVVLSISFLLFYGARRLS